MEECKRIGILTSGGDAPGMNAAIRAAVRNACDRNIKIMGIRRGFLGLLNEDFINLNGRSVSETIQRGGTILYTARCLEFLETGVQKKAAEILKGHGFDGLIVIGGDGSFKGALALSKIGVNVIGVPGTIDLDLGYTEYTIGFDTAINTAMEAIDKIRDTSTSHERCSIIEVMGRNAGYLALWSGIASGAEEILLPERYDGDEQAIVAHILRRKANGKTHHIIVNAEGVGSSISMAKRIEAATGIETRATIIGYMQRGGTPTCRDRMYSTIMGSMAVDLLAQGKANRVVGYRGGRFVDDDIEEGLAMTKDIPEYEYQMARMLSR